MFINLSRQYAVFDLNDARTVELSAEQQANGKFYL